jgi:hypothetical protein
MNNSIPLKQISAQIRKFEKNTIGNVVAIGRLLHEAHEQCEHGEYQAWLEREFAWSYSTCLRYEHAFSFAEKCHRDTFEKMNISLGALHVVASLSTSDEERAAIIKAALERRVTADIAKCILDELRNPPEQPKDPIELDDPLEPADPDEPDDSLEQDDPIEPDEDEESTPENLRGSVCIHADMSADYASGFMDQDIALLVSKWTVNGDTEAIVAAARRAEATWGALAARIEKAAGLKGGDITPGRSALKAKADRAEARARAVAI